MDSSSVISHSSQLLLEEIKLAFAEIHRRFDESAARCDRRVAELLAPREQQDAAEDLRVGALEQIDAVVVADNWGGLFEQPTHIPVVRDLLLSDAPVVADNWGGQFEQHDASSPPASLLAGENLKPSSFAPLQQVGSTDSAVAAPPPTLSEPSPPPSVRNDDEIPNHLHLANQIDSPGHADLSSAVSAAMCLSDSALIGIDAAKDVRVQTHATIVERVRPYLVLNKLDRLLTNPARRYLPAPYDASAVFTCSASVPSPASATAVQRAHVTTTRVPMGAEGLGDLRALELAGVVSATGEEPSFHLFRNDVSGAVPADALARLMMDALARHGQSSSPLLLRTHGTVHARAASVLDDPAAPARHHRAALQVAQRAVELAPASIDLAHFRDMLLFDAAAGKFELHAVAIFLTPCCHCRPFLQEIRGASGIQILVTSDSVEGCAPEMCTVALLRSFRPHGKHLWWFALSHEVSSTLSNRCSMNCLILDTCIKVDKSIQSCLLLPSCCRWDAVPHRQPWPPPPMQFELVCGSAAIRPTPWPPPDCIMAVLQLCVTCLPSWPKSLGMRGCLHWNIWECRIDSEIPELHPDIGNSSGVFAVKCTWRGSLLGSVEMQLSCGDWEPYFQWEAAREAMNTGIFTTSQDSVHCSAYVQNFCQELIYLARGPVTVLSVLSRGKGFKFRMLNGDESRDAVLLVFANKHDLPNAMNVADITDKLGLRSLLQRHWYIENTCAPAVYFCGLAMEDDPPDAAQCVPTLQMQELSADDGQGDVAQCITLQRQEHTADNEQGDTVQCTATRQRYESIADDTQGDFIHCTTALQWQGSRKAQCTTTSLRQEFLAAGGCVQEAALLRNSVEATTLWTTNKEVQYNADCLSSVSLGSRFSIFYIGLGASQVLRWEEC